MYSLRYTVNWRGVYTHQLKLIIAPCVWIRSLVCALYVNQKRTEEQVSLEEDQEGTEKSLFDYMISS